MDRHRYRVNAPLPENSRHPGGISTDTLQSTYSSATSSSGGEIPTSYLPHDAYDPGRKHKKNNSGQVLESMFGIYPETKKLGVGVSVADVVASKLFSLRRKNNAQPQNTTPTPINSKKRTGREGMQTPLPHQSSASHTSAQHSSESFGKHDSGYTSRDSMNRNHADPQPKLDDLLMKQRQLEEKIQQLKLERNTLLELDIDNTVGDYDESGKERLIQHPPRSSSHHSTIVATKQRDVPGNFPPQVQPLLTHNASSTIQARSFQDNKPRASRQLPFDSRTTPTLGTTPAPIFSSYPVNADAISYTTRPVPEVPIMDATPPPEYDQVIYKNRLAPPDSPTCKDMKISFPMPGSVESQEIILSNSESKEFFLDPNSAPREEIETEEILGWLGSGFGNENNGPRGRAPTCPLPRPPGDIRHPAAIDPFTFDYSNNMENYRFRTKPLHLANRATSKTRLPQNHSHLDYTS